jgi:YjbE family integral membrane protein
MIDAAGWLFLLLQIFFVDLLLGADNAIVIAFACRRLPAEDTRRAVMLGAAGAIALRFVMILFANGLLGVPLVKLAGAWMLVVIALNIKARSRDDEAGAPAGAGRAVDLVSAAAAITLADAAMSLDNVVALAAIAGGNVWLLTLGVLFSIPILAYGALILTEIMRRAAEIITVGAAFLGWIAGGMAASDALVAGWIQTNAPALAIFAPALVALFVLLAAPAAKRHELRPAAPSKTAAGRAPSPQSRAVAIQRTVAPGWMTPELRSRSAAVPEPAAPPGGRPPAFASDLPAKSGRGWTEEKVVVAGFVLLAFLAGLIIFIASFFDSLT